MLKNTQSIKAARSSEVSDLCKSWNKRSENLQHFQLIEVTAMTTSESVKGSSRSWWAWLAHKFVWYLGSKVTHTINTDCHDYAVIIRACMQIAHTAINNRTNCSKSLWIGLKSSKDLQSEALSDLWENILFFFCRKVGCIQVELFLTQNEIMLFLNTCLCLQCCKI